jgi:hypothetical protein
MVPNIVRLGLHNVKHGIYLYRNYDAFFISYLYFIFLFYEMPILSMVIWVVLLCVGS